MESIETGAVATQGLTQTYYDLACSSDVCTVSEIIPEKVEYASQQEEWREKRGGVADEAVCEVMCVTGKKEGRTLRCYSCGRLGHIAKKMLESP